MAATMEIVARNEHDLLEALAALVWQADRDTLAIVSVTEALAAALGPGFTGPVERWMEQVHPADRARVLEACRAVAADGAPREISTASSSDRRCASFGPGSPSRRVASRCRADDRGERLRGAPSVAPAVGGSPRDRPRSAAGGGLRWWTSTGVIQVARGSGAVRVDPGAVGRGSAFELFARRASPWATTFDARSPEKAVITEGEPVRQRLVGNALHADAPAAGSERGEVSWGSRWTPRRASGPRRSCGTPTRG